MNAALTSVPSPITSAPSIAPYGSPGPPRKTAARIRTRSTSVLVAPKVPEFIAKAAPARPHRLPEPGVADQPVDPDHRHDRERDDHELNGRQLDRSQLDRRPLAHRVG